MDNIVQPKYDTTCYVTQSWLNWTEPGGFHHSHYHPNSFISGVFYINANGSSDRIDFSKERHDHFDIEAGEYNLYNSKTSSDHRIRRSVIFILSSSYLASGKILLNILMIILKKLII